MRRYVILAILLICIDVQGQKMHDITLATEAFSSGFRLNFRVVKVIDGRKDRATIGLVQTGLANKLRFAVFESPIEQEVMGLITRSKVGADNPDIILRIEYLAVSEQTRATSETAKAEVTLDMFEVVGDKARFIARKHATTEVRGMEVTRQHAGNIVSALEEVFVAFNSYALKLPSENESIIELAEIEGYEIEGMSEEHAPVFVAKRYKDGLYASFEEFRDNAPSVTEGYEVKEGDPVKARWIDSNGKKGRVKDDVYALAHKNELYIFFNGFFYAIEKRPGGLYFVGPEVPNSAAVAAGGVLGGAIGGMIVAGATAKRIRYRIDLSNGSLTVVDR